MPTRPRGCTIDARPRPTRAAWGLAAIAGLGLVLAAMPSPPVAEAPHPGPIVARPAVGPVGVPFGAGAPWAPLAIGALVVALAAAGAARGPAAVLVVGAALAALDGSTRDAARAWIPPGGSGTVAGVEVRHLSSDRPVADVILAELDPSLGAAAACLIPAPGGRLVLWPGPGQTEVEVREVGPTDIGVVVRPAEGPREARVAPGAVVRSDGVTLSRATVSSGCAPDAAASLRVDGEVVRVAVGADVGAVRLDGVGQDGGVWVTVARRLAWAPVAALVLFAVGGAWAGRRAWGAT